MPSAMTSEDLIPPKDASQDAPEQAARLLAEAVAAAGALALTMFQADIRTWTKSNDSPVTEADLAVDRFLKERLEPLDPACGWLSEESADSADRLARRRVWVVDPIDGTRAFMAGEADWAVSAALVEDGRPIAGALFAPVTNELFVAARGAGTTVNGVPVRASARGTLDGASISGPAFLLDRAVKQAAFDVRSRVRSLALRLARVATADLDIALASANSYDWDIAAADIIVHEAGGALTGYEGAVPKYNKAIPRHGSLVCAGRHLHRAMLKVARDEFGAS